MSNYLNVRRRWLLALAMVLLAGGLAVPASPASADDHCGTPVVRTSGGPSRSGTPQDAVDGDETTGYSSAAEFSDRIYIDFGCIGTFRSFRRKMTDNDLFTTSRNGLREFVLYSDRGSTLTPLSEATTVGWTHYDDPSSPDPGWEGVREGWSERLVLRQPVQARYVQFAWTMPESDLVREWVWELDIEFEPPPSDDNDGEPEPPPLTLSMKCVELDEDTEAPFVQCDATANGGFRPYAFGPGVGRGTVVTALFPLPDGRQYHGRCLGGDYSITATVTDAFGQAATATGYGTCDPGHPKP